MLVHLYNIYRDVIPENHGLLCYNENINSSPYKEFIFADIRWLKFPDVVNYDKRIGANILEGGLDAFNSRSNSEFF